MKSDDNSRKKKRKQKKTRILAKLYIYIPFRMVSTNKTGAGTGYLLAARSAHIGGTILARVGRKSWMRTIQPRKGRRNEAHVLTAR